MLKASLKQVQTSIGAASYLNNVTGVKAKITYPVGRLFDALESEQKRLAPKLKKIFEDAGCTLAPILGNDGKPQMSNGEPLQKWAHEDAAVFAACELEAVELLTAVVELNAMKINFADWADHDVPGVVWSTLKWACKNLPGDDDDELPAAPAAPGASAAK